MTLSEYARHRGIKAAAVEEAILAGRISRTATGGIDPAVADVDWERNTAPMPPRTRKKRDESVDAAAGAQNFRTVAEARAAHAQSFDADKLGKLSFADARALKENFEAKLKFVELQEREGELLRKADVLRDVERFVRVTRDQLLNIPARVAAQVLALSELSDVEATIAEEITTALEDLADNLKRMSEGDPQ